MLNYTTLISLNCALYARGDIGILINKKNNSPEKINKGKTIINSTFYFHYQKKAQNVMEFFFFFLVFEAPLPPKSQYNIYLHLSRLLFTLRYWQA